MKPKNLLLSLAFLFLVQLNYSQSLDNSFNNNGIVMSPNSSGKDIIVGPTGLIYTISDFWGNQWDLKLSRLLSNGLPDISFGSGGTVITDISGGSTDLGTVVLLQPDGKIIVGGVTSNGGFNFRLVLVRYTDSGELDISFGSSGIVVANTSAYFEFVSTALLQNDGKIILLGTDSNGDNLDVVAVRYENNGNLDFTFGTNGYFRYDFSNGNDRVMDAMIQSDGKIVIVGNTLPYDSTSWDSFALRIDNSGTIDYSFGSSGVIILSPGDGNDLIGSVAPQSDGKLILYGSTYNGSIYLKFYACRLNTNGSMDFSFAVNGHAFIEYESELFQCHHPGKVIIQPDDKLLLIGGTDSIACSTCLHNKDFSIIRLTPEGFKDVTWGNDGIFKIGLSSIWILGESREYLQSGCLQQDGKLLVIGNYQNGSADIVMRLNTDIVIFTEEPKNLSNEVATVFPNPVLDNVNVLFDVIPTGTIELYNSIGLKIYHLDSDEKHTIINTENFAKGIYFIRILNNNKSFTKEIILQ